MPESAVSKLPEAHNHRDAPPGTAVKYGNGEMEIIETLVDVGHYEVQVTPDNCTSSLISVDQIVKDGHTVTFSHDATTITDAQDRYTLTYPRDQASREWSIPMQAMADISKLREQHPSKY
jgi:archaellum component FlaF (FlaF/FlaG flagellin family)